MGYPFDVDAFELGPETVVFDRARNQNVMRLHGTLVLPIGATIELTDPNVSATVIGVRLAGHGFGEALTLVLDVDVPAEWWAKRGRRT